MKNQLIDKFSRLGRLRHRLEEIIDQAERNEVARMEAGDLIGRNVVASLESEAPRDAEAARLLFDAELERARLYLESSGATPLDVAEAILDAEQALRFFESGLAERQRLVDPAWKNLVQLMDIGSRQNAWNIFKVVLRGVEVGNRYAILKPKVIASFAEIAAAMEGDDRRYDALGDILSAVEWAERDADIDLEPLLACLPMIVEREINEINLDDALRALALAERAEAPFSGKLFAQLASKLAEGERCDLEARQVYRRVLAENDETAKSLEGTFKDLAHVHPDPSLDFDSDLDSLNALLAKTYGETDDWPWRNRGLMARRRGDALGSLAFLARAMNITGIPTDLTGLLSPVLHSLGFEYSAREFARFASESEHARFRLEVLDQLESRARTREGLDALIERFEKTLRDVELPEEFRHSIQKRLAELNLAAGHYKAAMARYRAVSKEDPDDSVAIVRMDEIGARLGMPNTSGARPQSKGAERIAPHLFYIVAIRAEAADDIVECRAMIENAITAIPEANEAGRDSRHRNWLLIREKVVTMVGQEVADGPLMSMLQTDAYETPHRDLIELGTRLEQMRLDLALKTGDLDCAKRALDDHESRRPHDHSVHLAGARAALSANKIDDAEFFLDRLDAIAENGSDEGDVLRGMVFAKSGLIDEAIEKFEEMTVRSKALLPRVALASLKAESGDEIAATKILDAIAGSLPCLERGADAALDLYGRLLERAGRCEEARLSYQQVHKLRSDWNEARRRFGLHTVNEGVRNESTLLIDEGVRALEGFHDAESVEAEARGRAAMAPDPERAARTLETYRKRLSGEAERRIARLRLAYLLRLEDPERLEAEREQLRDDAAMKPLQTWLSRRDGLESLARWRGQDEAFLQKVAATLEGDDKHKMFKAAALLVRGLNDRDHKAKLPKDSPTPLLLAAAITGVDVGRDKKRRTSIETLARNTDDELAPVAKSVLTLGRANGTEFDAGPWAELEVQHGFASPYAENAAARLAAVHALAAGRDREFQEALEERGDELADLALLHELRVAIERRDTSAILKAVTRLSATSNDEIFGATQRRLQSLINDARETRSPAWASARLRKSQRRSRAFAPAVVEYWRSHVAESDEIPEARLHVALLELARAHEEESAGRENEETWFDSHRAWSELIEHVPFWESMSQRHDQAILLRVRSKLAERIIDAHLRRAEFFLSAEKLGHAIRHARLAHRSPLVSKALRPWVDERLMDVFAPGIERLLAKRDYLTAIERLDHVLVAAPDHTTARRDMVHVAAESFRGAFGVLDAFTKRPDPSTLLEIAQSMQEHATLVENHALTMAQENLDRGPEFTNDLLITLRAIAFLRFHRGRDAAGASEVIDMALSMASEGSNIAKALRAFRSEVGLKRVSDRMEQDGGGGDVWGEGIEEIDQLLATDPKNLKLRRQRVKLLLASGRDEEAEAAARDLFARAQGVPGGDNAREAIELLHQIQQGRESLRNESQREMLDQLIGEGNWRSALQLYRDISVGHEDDADFVEIHVKILTGLHKIRAARESLDKLALLPATDFVHRQLEARINCLEYMSAKSGDLYSAFELWERGDLKRAQSVLQVLPEIDARDVGARFLNAICQHFLVGAERAEPIVEQARRAAVEQSALWAVTILDAELSE